MIFINTNGEKRELETPFEIEIFKKAGWVEYKEEKKSEEKKTDKKTK